MIDHLVGRPSPGWKRTQVFLVILFWLWRIVQGTSGPPRILFLGRANRILQRFTPWQLLVTTLTAVYAVRNFDKILGLDAPEPLSRLYSPSYYRATWINTGLDAGFATAMSIRPKWLRDICSIVFSGYYIIYANEADEKLRRFRAVPTVEMLRTTWEKTSNPYIRMFTYNPSIAMCRKILLPRPKTSTYTRPISGYLFYNPSAPDAKLSEQTELILDFPGGGFVAMSPEHHEERLRLWAIQTGRPVLSLDYGKAPEYPYPFAIDEAFDAYVVLVQSVGTLIGMSGTKLRIIMSGDSAGATLAINVILKILEGKDSGSGIRLPQPVAVVLNYAALDFNFTSWMNAENLKVLREEQGKGGADLLEVVAGKDHFDHVSPLSMVGDRRKRASTTSGSSQVVPPGNRLRRRRSWKDTRQAAVSAKSDGEPEPISKKNAEILPARPGLRRTWTSGPSTSKHNAAENQTEENSDLADDSSDEDYEKTAEEDRPIRARVKYHPSSAASSPVVEPKRIPLVGSILEKQQEELKEELLHARKQVSYDDTKGKPEELDGSEQQTNTKGKKKEPVGTRLTMTSRTGYFQDRVISPSMMRAMAILYIGPNLNPDFQRDYHLSPILTPAHLLAHFPPLLMQCGEKDPFVDDTVIFAGRVREAKRARKRELDELLRKGVRDDLRMSSSGGANSRIKMILERDRLADQTDDDWVQLVLFSEWSHGYLQMARLMSEAKAVIEELAEWIDDAFGRHGHAAGSDHEDKSASHEKVPMNSETETDDTGITFVPKKYQSPGVGGSRTSSFSHHPPSDEGSTDTLSVMSSATLLTPGPVEEEYDANAERQGAVGSRPKGATITETELMRRRRLLDSHIFESATQ